MKSLILVLMLTLLGCSETAIEQDCDRLLRIQSIPMKATYEDIVKAHDIRDSSELDLCLANRISDSNVVPDPREAPPVQAYSRGDTAFFLLVLKHDWEIDKMISEPYRSRWRDQGIYAYFEYVSVEGNRRELQERVLMELHRS